MSSYHLPGGREVCLRRLVMVGTFAGALAGSPESLSAGLLRNAPDRAAELLRVVVIPPETQPLPDWFCVAELRSQKGARTTDPDYMSRLYVCWFAANTSQSLDAMIADLLPQLDWDREAEDFDFTCF